MEFSFSEIDATGRYKLMTGIVVPRPIAWVSSRNQDGSTNLAPFSFFNAIGTDPGLIVLGIGDHPDRPKDTAVNIEREKEFVVNLVPYELSQAMSDSAADYPSHISEVEALHLQTLPSKSVQAPRIAGCPAALECRLERILTIGSNRVLFGEVLHAYVEDSAMIDPARFLVDSQRLDLVGRMGGLGGYCRTTDSFQIERKRYQS